MKKLLLLLTMLPMLAFADMEAITVPVATNQITTGVLDVTKGAAFPLPASGIGNARINVIGWGASGTTGGALFVWLETAQSSSGPWDLYSDAAIKVSATGNGAAGVQGSDWFNLTGIKWMRWGAVSNAASGTFTNISANIILSQPGSFR